jgi:hypothetical protein
VGHPFAAPTMRAETLHARSVNPDAAVLLGPLVVAAVVAFARLWGLMVSEEWLAPLVVMMLVQFLAGCLLAHRDRVLTPTAVKAELTIKALVVLAYIAGFAVQRMFEGDPSAPSNMASVGHATAGGLIGFEVVRFGRVLRAFGLRAGPFEGAVVWFETTFAGEARKREMLDAKADAKAEGRFQQKVDDARRYMDTGEIKVDTAVLDVIDKEYRDSGVLKAGDDPAPNPE